MKIEEQEMTNKTPIIAAIEKEQMNKDIPDFSPGDTVVVQVKVKEGSREQIGRAHV